MMRMVEIMGMVWIKLIPALVLNHHPILVDNMAALAIRDIVKLNLVRVLVDIAHLLMMLVWIHLRYLCDALGGV